MKFAGGFTKNASRFSSYVTYPDGFSKKQSLLKLSPTIKDGSIITVIAKDSTDAFSLTNSITEITDNLV